MYEILDENYIHSHGSDVNIFFLKSILPCKSNWKSKSLLVSKVQTVRYETKQITDSQLFWTASSFSSYFDSEEIIISYNLFS